MTFVDASERPALPVDDHVGFDDVARQGGGQIDLDHHLSRAAGPGEEEESAGEDR
jgi:hypothetical protein